MQKNNTKNDGKMQNKHRNKLLPITLLPITLVIASIVGCNAPDSLVASTDKFDVKDLKLIEDGEKVNQTMTRNQQIEHAQHHLAEKLSVDVSTISIAGSESVTWRSSAMGCPKPGMMYTQALVPGVLIMLKVGGTAYRYHASTDGAPSYCPGSQAESPSASPGDV